VLGGGGKRAAQQDSLESGSYVSAQPGVVAVRSRLEKSKAPEPCGQSSLAANGGPCLPMELRRTPPASLREQGGHNDRHR
jgi:hypothetical protein